MYFLFIDNIDMNMGTQLHNGNNLNVPQCVPLEESNIIRSLTQLEV